MTAAVLAVLVWAWAAVTMPPLWGDEVLQYVFGAYASTREAWWVLRNTVTGINFGQTGALFMADHWLLRACGAHAWALRLPSLAAGVVLLGSVLVVARQWGLPPAWRAAAVLALAGQPLVMFHLTEARPYMSLAASAAAALAWYGAPAAWRRGPAARALGALILVAGGIVHPYFPLYALLAVVVTLPPAGRRGWWAQAWRHADVAAALPGAAAWTVLGANSWMRGHPVFAYDPLLYMGTWRGAAALFVVDLAGRAGRWVLLAAAVVAALRVGRRPAFRAGPALTLLGGAPAVAAVLCAVSVHQRYILIERQWLASMALMALAVAGIGAAIARTLPPRWGRRWTIAVCAVLAIQAGRTLATRSFRPAVSPAAAALSAAGHVTARGLTMDDWVRLANLNCDAGGPVWPVFKAFYTFDRWPFPPPSPAQAGDPASRNGGGR